MAAKLSHAVGDWLPTVSATPPLDPCPGWPETGPKGQQWAKSRFLGCVWAIPRVENHQNREPASCASGHVAQEMVRSWHLALQGPQGGLGWAKQPKNSSTRATEGLQSGLAGPKMSHPHVHAISEPSNEAVPLTAVRASLPPLRPHAVPGLADQVESGNDPPPQVQQSVCTFAEVGPVSRRYPG